MLGRRNLLNDCNTKSRDGGKGQALLEATCGQPTFRKRLEERAVSTGEMPSDNSQSRLGTCGKGLRATQPAPLGLKIT